jgi:hypothetical protein
LAATCADPASIIDDFARDEWHGAGACSKRSSDLQAFVQADEVTAPAVSVGKPWDIDAKADRA